MAIVLTLLNIGCETDDDKLWLIIFIVIYMFFHSIGYGPLPWILMPEICPRKVSQKFKFKLSFKNSCCISTKHYWLQY